VRSKAHRTERLLDKLKSTPLGRGCNYTPRGVLLAHSSRSNILPIKPEFGGAEAQATIRQVAPLR
jgi:hypothetical protein